MIGKDKEDVSPKPDVTPSISWRHYLPGPILFLHLLAFILSLNTAGLYVPLYVSKTLFPQRPLPASTGTICTVNETVASPETETIQKEVALFNVYVALASGIPAVITSVFLGAFSDRFGRIFLFLTPTIGQFISKTIILFCIFYRIDINFILIGSAIEGFTGGFLAILMAAFSYIADVTENNKERSAAIAFLEIAVGVGLVIGRFSTGYLINATNYVWPQVTACGIYTTIIMVILFVLPETRAPKALKPLTSLSCQNYVKTIFSFYVSKTADRWKYNICILIFFATGITVVGKSGVDLLYQISQPFCWDSVKVGWYGALAGLFQNVICMGMIKVLHLCFNDEGVSILGSISGIAGLTITAFATTDAVLYIAAILGGGAVLTIPMVRAMMSRMTSPEKQGALFGGISSMETACFIVGNLIFNPIYSHTVSIFRGIVYLVMAGSVLVSLILLVILTMLSRTNQLLQPTTTYTINGEVKVEQD